MKILLSIIAISLALILVIACGGESGGQGKLLQLRNSNITENSYRNVIRHMFLQPGASAFCKSLQGLTPQEIIDANEPGNPSATALPNSTPVANQEPDMDDLKTATGIITEECERILS